MKIKIQGKEQLKLNSSFKNHAEIAKRINSLNLGWTAKVYDDIKDKTIGEMNKMYGEYNPKKPDDFSFKSVEKKTKFSSELEENFYNNFYISNERTEAEKKPLKKNVDFRPIMGKIKSQGGCGSCYAQAATTMLEARIRRKYSNILKKYIVPKDFLLSVEHVLDCSIYNQGCHGGYPYLVGKFFHEFETMPKTCYKKGNCMNTCKEQKTPMGNLKFNVTDYYYVGGHYGATKEEGLMRELVENGPFVISISPSYIFRMYEKGIMDGLQTTWKQLGIEKPEWERVDHSTVLVGYGVENGKEYWLIQNSWGDDWGESGYFRIAKGKNLMAIESLGQCAKIELTDEKN